MFANKKITINANSAQQNAKILKVVGQLLDKNLIEIREGFVFLHLHIWKEEAITLNWMKCLYIYCHLKKHIKIRDTLYFKDITTLETIGLCNNNNAKILISLPQNMK